MDPAAVNGEQRRPGVRFVMDEAMKPAMEEEQQSGMSHQPSLRSKYQSSCKVPSNKLDWDELTQHPSDLDEAQMETRKIDGEGNKDFIIIDEKTEFERKITQSIEKTNSRILGFLHASWTEILHGLQDYLAIVKVFFRYLISFDTILYILIVTGSTCFYYYYQSAAMATELNWVFFTFAVVFPVSWNITEAYRRRETALQNVAHLKALIYSIYMANRDWDFGTPNKDWNWRWSKLPNRSPDKVAGNDEHTNQVREVLLELCRSMRDFLLLPCPNQLRHMHTAAGRKEMKGIMQAWQFELCRMKICYNRLSLAVEILKASGMPGNEAARINQYIMLLQARFNMLRYAKGYRTPEGIRAYARLLIFIHPFFYGSYYAYVALNTNLAFALMFSYMIGLALVGLVNVEKFLEDPFQSMGNRSQDRVRAEKIFGELIRDLSIVPVEYMKVVACSIPLSDALIDGLPCVDVQASMLAAEHINLA